MADPRPFDENNFELFDMEADPGELTDLSDVNPQKKEEMIALWQVQRLAMGVILPADL